MDRQDYDRLWRTTWGDMQHVGPVHRHIQADLYDLVRRLEVRSILDVGCGSGEILAGLARRGAYELRGTDLSEAALALARSRVPGARFARLDVERESLPERADLVLSVQVLEHLRDDTAAVRHLAEMSARYVFVSTMAGRMRPSERHIGHVRNYDREELRQKLTAAGLEVRWIRGWGFPFYSPIYRTLVELLPGGPPSGSVGGFGRIAAALLYQLYRLNWPGRGDVISALATVRRQAADPVAPRPAPP